MGHGKALLPPPIIATPRCNTSTHALTLITPPSFPTPRCSTFAHASAFSPITADRHHRKFGYISTTNGSQLQLSIPNPASSSAPLVVFLSFLRSYDDMARADVVCSSGCSCVQTSLQGSWKIHASVTQLQPIEITKFDLGANCTIGILHRGGVRPTSKFKLSGLMLTEKDNILNEAHGGLFGHYSAD